MSEYSDHFRRYKEFLNRRVRIDFGVFGIPKDACILDAGCGFGDRMRFIRDAGYADIKGIDPDPACVENSITDNITLGSITSTGFGSSTFDCVLVEGVFHHLPEYGEALREIHRILKPGGSLCIIELRNSIPRAALDFITFNTPLPHIFRGPLILRRALVMEEIKTGYYQLWLRSFDIFFRLVQEYFSVEFLKDYLFCFCCKARKPLNKSGVTNSE